MAESSGFTATSDAVILCGTSRVDFGRRAGRVPTTHEIESCIFSVLHKMVEKSRGFDRNQMI
jgi:hypothetical protein